MFFVLFILCGCCFRGKAIDLAALHIQLVVELDFVSFCDLLRDSLLRKLHSLFCLLLCEMHSRLSLPDRRLRKQHGSVQTQ